MLPCMTATVHRLPRKCLVNAVRLDVLASGPCVYCAAPATTVDHDVPITRGGTDERSNLVPACWPCNSRKGTLTGAEFRAQYQLPPERRAVLDRILAEIGDTPAALVTEGGLRHDRHRHAERELTRLAHLGGAVVWGLRQQGLSWRRIDELIGVEPRTARRWLDLFLAEGIEAQAPAELERRFYGREVNGDE